VRAERKKGEEKGGSSIPLAKKTKFLETAHRSPAWEEKREGRVSLR